MIPGSFTVAINPQLFIGSYKHASYFQKVTGLNLSEYDPFLRNNLGQVMKKSTKTRFLLIENINSDCDYDQIRELLSEFGSTTKAIKEGISYLNSNIVLWNYYADSANMGYEHNSQE